MSIEIHPLSTGMTYPLSLNACAVCSNGVIQVYHGLGEACPGFLPAPLPVSNWNWIVPQPTADCQLTRLWSKLPPNAVVGVSRTEGGWGAFVTGVERPCEVTGFSSEAEAKEALVEELMQRAVSRCCGGSDG